MAQNRETRKRYWWRFGETTPALFGAIDDMERVLALSQTSARHALVFLPGGTVYSQSLVVFPLPTHAAFCALQSRPHEVWARFFGSSMKDDLRYTPSDCFETFPFPENWTDRSDLEAAGRAYYDHRAALMIEREEGLTKTYNRFHDPEQADPKIAELRELHAAMDRAVLEAYGWGDVDITCDFILDHEDDEQDTGRRRRPWRYRWPDAVRDEVLARLIALNGERAAAEERSGTADGAARRRPARARPTVQAEKLL